MIISRAAEYGLIAVGYIALNQKEGKLTAKVISKKFNIPSYFLLKILTYLSKAGILSSKRGPAGGHVLGREPEKISLLEIIRAIEGSTFDLFDPFNIVADKPNELFLVRMKEVCEKAKIEENKVLSEATLAEMIGSKKR